MCRIPSLNKGRLWTLRLSSHCRHLQTQKKKKNQIETNGDMLRDNIKARNSLPTASCFLLLRLFFGPEEDVGDMLLPKRLLTFNGLHAVIFQKIESNVF
jgi:hypothetical protein